MKPGICILFFTSVFLFNLSAQDEYIITWDYRNQTFKDFVVQAENIYPIKFFFRDEWIKDLRAGAYGEGITISEYLDNLLRGNSLYYYIDEEGRIVITKNFAVKVSAQADDENFIPPAEYPDSRDSPGTAGNIFVDIGNPADKYKSGNVVISGYISDHNTKVPVSGATVYVRKLSVGTISNEYSFYSLTLPRGVHLLQFSFTGMKERMVNINLYGDGEMNIEMSSVLIPLKETVVSADRNMTLQRFEVGMERLNITSFRLLPTSMGESDIIKSILLVPGVQSVGEGSAGFNVRGGSADQNLILLYGAPVYNSSHFFGFFSAVNSDIIRDVTLYKGGIPGRYGGRISSVLDIGSKDGNRKEFFGNAGISPITAHVMIEGPLIKDTCSYILTARSTYSNWIFKLIDNPALQRSRASFYDLNGRITYDINKNNKLEISSYFSHDSFRFNSDTVYSYNNNIIALRWRHFFSNRFFLFLSLNNSSYNYDISSQSVATEGFVLSHRLNSTGLKADFNWFQGRNETYFGLDLTGYAIMPGSYLPSGDSSLVIPSVIPREKALEAALYIDDKFMLTDYMSINMGLRISSFFAYGPREVMVYNPLYPKVNSSITDTLSFKANEIIRSYAGPEFRISLNFRLTNKSSLKINYNRTRQYLHLLSNTTSISPTDTWKLSDYYLKPQTGDQVAFGFYRMFIQFISGMTMPDKITDNSEKPKIFYGKPDIELIMDDYIKLPVMEEVFLELLPGAFLKMKRSVYEISIADPVTNSIYDIPPVLLIDGVVIDEPEIIAGLDPETVEEIDVVKERYMVGDYMSYGIVNVITRAGDYSYVTLPDHAVRLSYIVAEPVCSFHFPDYSTSEMKQSRIPDFRNTLYWNPSVEPDEEGKARVEFWSSDYNTDYLINIQGITAGGTVISYKEKIRIEKSD